MLEHILVATDLSHRAEMAIARGVELAARFGARLTLLHVVEHDQPDSYVVREVQQARDALAEEAKLLRGQVGDTIQVQVVSGDPFERIGDIASEVAAGFIVMGRHRRRPIRDLFVGTTVERVIWRGTHPVLMVKHKPIGPYRHVGIATDCSAPSATALRVSAALGFLDDVRLSVIHARIPFARAMLAAHANEHAVRDHVNAELREAREEVKTFLEENGRGDLLNHRLYLDEGEPLDVLRAWAERQDPDLLVMGTHGRSGIGRMFLGSVTEEALRTLDLDILAIPPHAEG